MTSPSSWVGRSSARRQTMSMGSRRAIWNGKKYDRQAAVPTALLRRCRTGTPGRWPGGRSGWRMGRRRVAGTPRRSRSGPPSPVRQSTGPQARPGVRRLRYISERHTVMPVISGDGGRPFDHPGDRDGVTEDDHQHDRCHRSGQGSPAGRPVDLVEAGQSDVVTERAPLGGSPRGSSTDSGPTLTAGAGDSRLEPGSITYADDGPRPPRPA